MTEEIRRVVIAGGGTAGWLAAAALGKHFGELLEIVLVESDSIGTIGVGESTIPPLRAFHKVLGIDEEQFIRATAATFKLGIQFENWKSGNDQYFHGFGILGRETWLAGFQHFWLSARERGLCGDFQDYSIEARSAHAGKFGIPKQFPMHYSYHLDSTKYARFLRTFSERHGVHRMEGKILTVSQDPDTGWIQSLTLDSGHVVTGDLFLDCTGFRGLLIEQTLNTGFEDWGHWLPCDRAVVAQTKSIRPAPPYTRAIAHDAGWRWQIPLQHRVGNGLVFSSAYLDDEQAQARLLQSIEGELVSEPQVIRYRTGRRRATWNNNCVALGLASGFVEPLESTGIHLFMTGITRLLQLFPFGGINFAITNEYNQQTQREIERIRDFIVLHYHLTQRNDSAFWHYCRTMPVPDELAQKIELFEETGHAFRAEGDTFRVESWTQVMIGQGLMPKRHHQIARTIPEPALAKLFTDLDETLTRQLQMLPQHHEFISQLTRSR